MCLKLSLLLTLLFVVALSGCGKKTEQEESAKKSITDKTNEELSFELNNELKVALDKNDLNLFKDILRKNPSLDLNKILADGETLLTTVIKRDYRDFRNYLIEKGANIERANASKETPLIAAALSRSINTVEVLLDKLVDLNKKDLSGLTALHHAIMMTDESSLPVTKRKEFESLAILLVKANANVELTTPEDKNAYRLAIDHNSIKLQEIIRTVLDSEYGTPDMRTFSNVIKQGNAASLGSMLTRYPNMPVSYEETNPLLLAIEYNKEISTLAMLQLLIANKANINGPKDAQGSPLMKAVQLLNESYVAVLLEAKANPQVFDAEGKSPLFFSVTAKDFNITKALYRAGALPRYSYKQNGVKFSFDACYTIKQMERTASLPDQSILENMKKALECRSRLFGLPL